MNKQKAATCPLKATHVAVWCQAVAQWERLSPSHQATGKVHMPWVRLGLWAQVPIPPLPSFLLPQFSHLQNCGNVRHCVTRPSLHYLFMGFYRLTPSSLCLPSPQMAKSTQLCATSGTQRTLLGRQACCTAMGMPRGYQEAPCRLPAQRPSLTPELMNPPHKRD